MSLSHQEISRRIGLRFGLEHESETPDVEVEVEVNFAEPGTIDSEVEAIEEGVASVAEADESINSAEETQATLESLIVSLEHSAKRGGLSRESAVFANITMESIANRYSIPSAYLVTSLEDVAEDSEVATLSMVDKAKAMLREVGTAATDLLGKMYSGVLGVLGEIGAVSDKLLAKSAQLKSNLTSDNKGGLPVKLSKGSTRFTKVNRGTVPAQTYVKELNRVTKLYNSVTSTYADNEAVKNLVISAISAGGNGAKAVKEMAKELEKDMMLKSSSKTSEETLATDAYLGDAIIQVNRMSIKEIQSILNLKIQDISKMMESGQTVSNESGNDYSSWKKILTVIKIALLNQSLTLSVAFTATSIYLTASTFLSLIVPLSLHGLAVITLGTMITWYAAKAVKFSAMNMRKELDNLVEMFKAEKNSAKDNTDAEEIQALTTTYSLRTRGIGMEADESENALTSLSYKDCQAVLSMVDSTAAATKTIKSTLNSRKKTVADLQKMAKQVEKEGFKGAKAAYSEINKWIKSACKFEMDVAHYSVKVLKAAVEYVEVSNNAALAQQETVEV